MAAPRTCHCDTCPRCRGRDRFNRTYRAKAYGTWQPARVDAARARRHLDALPYGNRTAAARANLGDATISRIKSGATRRISRTTEQAILALTTDDPWLVDSTGTTRRLRALVAIGHPRRTIAADLHLGKSRVAQMLAQRFATVQRPTVDAVTALYAQLSMTPGPSDEARAFARNAGWHTSLCWDDDLIDDPTHEPIGCCGQQRPKTLPADIALLAAQVNEHGARTVAERYGVTASGVTRALRRAGWYSLAAPGKSGRYEPPEQTREAG
jgi:hypothetical protein